MPGRCRAIEFFLKAVIDPRYGEYDLVEMCGGVVCHEPESSTHEITLSDVVKDSQPIH
jgi:hypothetical protein